MGAANMQGESQKKPAATTARRGFSLWLMPPPAVRERYAGLIDRLAARLGTPRFEPHITLGGCDGTEAQAVARVTALAAHLAPVAVQLGPLETTEQYFRCLYLRAERTAALLGAHRQAALACGVEPDAEFLPHLSLVYGELPKPVKENLLTELGGRLDEVFVTDRIALCLPEGDPSAWRLLGPYPLAGQVGNLK
jgi:hypothetical protein